MSQHPTEESINITRKFLGQGAGAQAPSAQVPGQAAPGVKKRPLGQQGVQQAAPQGSLGDRFLGLPGPVGFSKTPQGQAILQRILGGTGRRR